MILLRQETVMSDGRIKRWTGPPGDGALYQVKLSLDADPNELASVERVVYRVTTGRGLVVAPSTRPHHRFAAALWARPPASISVVVEYLAGRRQRVETELSLDLPVDDGTNYEDVDLRYCF
jgi:hypothetical protein